MGAFMPTGPLSPTGPLTWGRDWNFFQKVAVSVTSFNTGCDVLIPFTTQGVIFSNLTLPAAGSKIVEYSFNGNTVHGELDAASGSQSISLKFDSRVISKVWFRVQSGSSGTINVSVQAWATH